jgi:outer membrane immunogenic protein
MRKNLIAVIGVVCSGMGVAPACAADLAARPYAKAPAPIAAPVYDWSGFYIGVNGGGGWSRKCWDITGQGAVNPAEGCHDATGALAGGQVGYRWQASNWVFGLEAQGDWADLRGSNGSVFFIPGAVVNRTKIDAIGLFTGQVGYAINNVLFYVKGGAMVANDKYEGFGPFAGTVFDRGNETRWGGAVGAGLDFGITPNIVLGVDYMHGFLGTRDVSLASTIIPGFVNRIERIQQDVDIVTARVSYKFSGPVVAKY